MSRFPDETTNQPVGNSPAICTCRTCHVPVSAQAPFCPHCGAPCPADRNWNGYGFEFVSKRRLFGQPILHVSFKYKANRMPVPARGIIAVGQVGVGVFVIAQFGLGAVVLSQFALGLLVIAQFAAAWSCVAQFGIYLMSGRGQFVFDVVDTLLQLQL